MSRQLQDKIAIVTGAASGIGKQIASTFAREGARVAIADLNRDAAQAVADELKAQGGQAMAVRADVTDEAQVDTAVASVVSAWGGVDVLVSNAGIQIVHPLEEFSYAEWKRMIAIHLDGAFLTTKACLPHMYASGRGGSVIYMGSVHSKEASIMKAPYVAAKHGLIGLAKVIAKEGGKHKVRANVICPGFVRTPLVDRQIPEQAKALGISEDEVVKKVFLSTTVDGEFTTVAGGTVEAAGLATTPYHVDVPSFGDWGFVLAGPGGRPPLAVADDAPVLRFLTPAVLEASATFPPDRLPDDVEASTLLDPVILRYQREEWVGY